MNNSEYRAAKLIKDAMDSVHHTVEGLATHAGLIDNFCENMPDETIQYLYAGVYTLSFTVKGGPDVLAAAIRFFRTRGWVLNSERPTTKMAHWEGKFTHGELANMPKVTVTFSSNVCKMVKVGTVTKTYEENVYELQCEDGSNPVEETIGDVPPHEGVAAVEPAEGQPVPSEG